jgi:Gpi18-like mannosyltransferase
MFALNKSTILLAIFIYAVYFLIMPPFGHDYDMGCFAQWAVHIFNHGLGDAYNSGGNYLPGHYYEIKLYTMLFHSEAEVIANIYYLKYFTLIFDVTGALLVSSLAKKSSVQQLLFIALMLNPSYLHNNLIWGQFDSVFSCFAFASFLAISRNKFSLASILYVISLNFKLQAIIFAPILLPYFIYKLPDFSIKRILICILAALITQTIILIPFMHGVTLISIWNVARSQTGVSGYISLEAANIWQLLMQGDLRWTSDNTLYAGIKLKTWGLLMYSLSLLIILLPYLKFFVLKIKNKISEIEMSQILLTFSLAPLVFFFFNTQMHERYSYPAFLFIAAYAFMSNSWWAYALFSLAYFLNTDKLMQCITKMNYNAPCFEFDNIAIIFLVLIIILAGNLILPLLFRKKFNLNKNIE